MQPGSILGGRYVIERTAGTGGMGVVYQAQDLLEDRRVAIKLVRRDEIGSAERFFDEINVLAELQHPHIVAYLSHGVTEEGAPFLVMPWLEGENLQYRLAAGPLGVQEALQLTRAIAGALAHLHERGLIHRDLKPSNIFLAGGALNDVKLLDFGIARAAEPTRRMTSSGVLVGTPGYMAPEQARGDRVLSPAVDVFALGCVVFECLTGRALFSGSHAMAILAKVILEEPPRVSDIRPDVPAFVDELVRAMVTKEPHRRPADGGQLAHYLDDLVQSGHAPASSSPSTGRLTGAEQRVVTVLVINETPLTHRNRPDADTKTTDLDPVPSLAERFDVNLHSLADGTAIGLAAPGYEAADQAALLARFARHLADSAPGTSVALATGRAVTGGRLPVGEAIERGVKLIQSPALRQGIRLDDVTATLISGRFDIQRDATSIVVIDELQSLDPRRPLLGHPTPCVGRERELSIIQATLIQCADEGGARAILVTAEAGMGKSRLRHEFVRRMEGQPGGPTVWQCRGDPLHSVTPYALVTQIVRQAVGLGRAEETKGGRERLAYAVAGRVPADDERRVTEFLGELIGIPFDDDSRLQLRAARKNASAMADQIGRAFEEFIRAQCAKGPLVLVMEDLHWADSGSIKLVDALLRKLSSQPLLVLALARPEVHDRFPSLWRDRDMVVIRLPPLPPRAALTLTREILGSEASEQEIARIVERADGNAFFLEELIRATAEGAPPEPPESVLAVAQARLQRMDYASRKLLRAASIYGAIFWQEGASFLVDDEPQAISSLLDSLVQKEAIVERHPSRFPDTHEYAFRHALLRSAAHATLTAEDRRLGHRLAGQWLERVGEEPEAVALHWLEAAESTRAAASFELAARNHWERARADAAARCAARALLFTDTSAQPVELTTERVRLLAVALDATRGVDGKEIVSGLESHLALPPEVDGANSTRGVVQFVLWQVVAGLRKLERSTDGWEGIALAGCAFGSMADLARARSLLAEAATLAGGHADRVGKVQRLEAIVACWAGDYGRAYELLSQTDLPASDDLDGSAEALMLLASATVAVGGKDQLARGLECVSKAESLLLSKKENPVLQILGYKTRTLCYFFGGDYDLAKNAAIAGVEVARRGGLRFEECLQLHNLGEQYVRLGDRASARDALGRALELSIDIGAAWLKAGSDALLGYLDGLDGDDQAPSRLAAHAESFRRDNLVWQELHVRYWLGLLWAARSDPRAQVELERGLDIARQLSLRVYEEDCRRALADRR